MTPAPLLPVLLKVLACVPVVYLVRVFRVLPLLEIEGFRFDLVLLVVSSDGALLLLKAVLL